ncbi:MAG: flagellar hook-length control protein FliK [Pseudomonadota bacterium]
MEIASVTTWLKSLRGPADSAALSDETAANPGDFEAAIAQSIANYLAVAERKPSPGGATGRQYLAVESAPERSAASTLPPSVLTRAAAGIVPGAIFPSTIASQLSARQSVGFGESNLREPVGTIRDALPPASSASVRWPIAVASSPLIAPVRLESPAPGVVTELPPPIAENIQRLGVESVHLSAHPNQQPHVTTGDRTEFTIRHPVGSDLWGAQLAGRITFLVNHQIQTATVQLDPPELGPIQVAISVNGDNAQVNLNATLATTRDAIEASLGRLRDALADGGFTGVDVEVRGGDRESAKRESSSGPPSAYQFGAGEEESVATPHSIWLAGIVDRYV